MPGPARRGRPPPARPGRAGRWAPRRQREEERAEGRECLRRRGGRGRATWVRTNTIRQGYRRDLGNLVHGEPQSGCATPPVHCTAVRVDQVIPSLASRDAIGVHTLNLRDGLRAAGIDSDIFYGSHTQDVQAEGKPVIELGRAGRDRWLLYQASIGSPVYDILAARPEPKLVNYHNITPADLLRDWEPAVAYEVALGRTQLARLAPQSRFAVADSAFNESELQRARLRGDGRRPAADRHAVQERRARPASWRGRWRAARSARAGPTCSTWARSRRTRRRTISSRCSTCSGAPTTRPPACISSAPRSGRPTNLRCGPSSTSSGWPTSSTWRARSAAPSSRPTSAPRMSS